MTTQSSNPPAVAPPALPVLAQPWKEPAPGDVITSMATKNTYTMGEKIGEGFFGRVFACVDGWNNSLAAKVLKPIGTYDGIKQAALGEINRLVALRHPNITYVYDAFEYQGAFYIVTERCWAPVTELFKLNNFAGHVWVMPIARCLLQAVEYLHRSGFAHQDIHAGNVFTSFAKNELMPNQPGSIQFKLGDLGVCRLLGELDRNATLKESIRPPEGLDAAEFGPFDQRIDIYHLGLLLLQLALGKEMSFTPEETRNGEPRNLALTLQPPLNFALEKALRRHVQYRTATAMELWRDLNSAVPQPGSVGGVRTP